MLVPVNWLKKYVDINVSINKLTDLMTMTGSNVENVEKIGGDICNVVVGRIINIGKHPNADRLVICKVDIGAKIIQVVTGAPNIEQGQLVPVALDGAVLSGGNTIRSGKLRGIESQGMLCSGEELNLKNEDYPGAEIDGILILKEEYPLGLDIKKALELDDEVIEFEITSNRPDCLSMVGIAREVAVTTKGKLNLPQINVQPGIGNIQDEVSIQVDDPELCPRYSARVIKNINIQPSPQWMRRRLAAAGIRPINNIVDITNYVMLELGQPMHAFDLDKLADRQIIVRRAKEGEKLTTLDGKSRILNKDMLVIADSEKPVGLAGVMGGANSEITPQTQNILLESAKFYGKNIRMTSKKLGLKSEASSRYEKGINLHSVITALDRAAQLIQELNAGTVVNGVIDVCGAALEPQTLNVQWKDINKLLGLNLPVEKICDILTLLNFKTEIEGELLKVIVPHYRLDIEGTADLAEEVARIYGYNNIPMTLMQGTVSKTLKSDREKMVDKAKEVLVGMGLYECITYSFTSPGVFETIGIKDADQVPMVVKISNPLGEDQSVMRTTLIPSILEVLSRNFNRRADKCQVFEIGKVFFQKSLPLEELPEEKNMLTLGEYGQELGFLDLKGQLEVLFDAFGLSAIVDYIPCKHPTFHPGRAALVKLNEIELGIIGEIHPKIAENYQMKTRVLLAELDFDEIIMRSAANNKKYEPLPKYPAVTRDLALVLKKNILSSQIYNLIRKTGGPLLEQVELFDIYEGSQIPEGYKSMAYALSYRAQDRTLKDEEVNEIHQKIVNALENDLGARLR